MLAARKRLLFVSACVIALPIIGFELYDRWGDEPFSSAAWLEADKYDREKYLRSLETTVLKPGIDKGRVLEVLGRPDSDFESSGEETCAYIIGHGHFMSVMNLLDLRFINGKLTRIIVREN